MMKRVPVVRLCKQALIWQVLAVCALAAPAVSAAELTVLSGGAIEPGLRAAAATFEKQTGHTVKITFNTAPQIRARVGAGESWDVVIAPEAVVDEFTRTGKLNSQRVTVGRVGLGAAVRPGAPVPDISSAEALKRSVRAADSIVFNRASTGVYFEGLLKKMGVYEQVEGKITRYADGASVMEHVLKGKGAEIGFGALTEILLQREKGLRLVGPLPGEVQNYTSYAAASMAAASSTQLAAEFVRFLVSPAAQELFAAAGIDR